MNKLWLIVLLTLFFLPSSNIAAKIVQCVQANGTIEFTNQGCSSSSTLKSKTLKANNYSNKTRNKKRRRAPFLQTEFVLLQKRLIRSDSSSDYERHAQSITNKVQLQLQSGKLKSAYDMIAATYVKLSKDLKQKQWHGQPINIHTLKIHALFEEILISQSSIANNKALNQVIKKAWHNYQGDA